MFKKIDWTIFNKPPFFPGWMTKSETLDLAKIPDKQLEDFEENVHTLAEQYDKDVIKNNTALIDRNGSLLGLKRQGQSNEEYLKLQNLRKLLNTNNSTVNDIIAILKLYYNNEKIEIIPDYPAGLKIKHYGESADKVNFNIFIAEVIGAGISYATEQYYLFNDSINISENVKLKKYDLDEVHYDGQFCYDGFIQYGNMRASRTDNNILIKEELQYNVINV